ncbi:MAG: hypothetical protein ACRD4B_05280 [Acidobacteriota bacterium]
MNAAQIRAEQGISLAAMLRSAGVRHGDEVDVELEGVGVYSSRDETKGTYSTIAFCPAYLTSLKGRREGTREEHAQPLPESLTLHDPLIEVLQRRLVVPRAFIGLNMRIRSNGSLHLLKGEVHRLEPVDKYVPVRSYDSYSLYSAGK